MIEGSFLGRAYKKIGQKKEYYIKGVGNIGNINKINQMMI